MNDMFDGLGGVVFSFFVIGLILAVIVFGIMLTPVAVAGVGGLYYWRNVIVPRRKEAELEERTRTLAKRASEIAPHSFEFFDRLEQAGFVENTPEMTAAMELYVDEGLAPPPAPPPLADTIEGARYRDRLLKYIESADTGRYQEFERAIVKYVAPAQVGSGTGIFQSRARRSPQEIEELILPFFDHDGMFRELRSTLDRNFNEQKAVYPSKYKGDNCAFDYLKDTPLLQLEYIEKRAGLTNRTAHTMILGGSGSGKTNMIEYIVGQDLSGDDDCTVVVLDSQVQLIPKLANLELPIEDLAYLNPRWDIGLNLFDVGYDELKASGDAETAINKAVGLIRFVLEGTLSSAMTDRQRTMFDYAIQLIISIPGGNMLTFIDMLDEDGINKYGREIAQFDSTTQDFFIRDWGSDDYKVTRNAIRARLLTLLKNPTFRRLFASKQNKFRIYDELQSRRLILLDTNKPMLDNEGSSFLGRLYIAMVVQAAHRRFDTKGKDYRPVYFVIDEAQEYFDERIAEMLEQARKANIGLILAHQTISQIRKKGLDPATVIGNTATKIVSTTLPDDAGELAKGMRVKKDEILDLPQYTFAMYHRSTGFTPIRAPEHALVQFEYRTDKDAVQVAMEARYGATNTASEETDEPATGKYGPGDEYAPRPGSPDNEASEPNHRPPPDDLDDVQPI